MRVGVLTGGGDCPGLNAVIRAIVRKGVPEYGYSFLGFRDGWRGPLDAVTRTLDIPAVRGQLPRGGTILGSSRTNPFAVEDGVERIRRNLQNLGVDALIAIGGEDTLGVATKLHEVGVKVIGVPKTIDNDLSGTDYTFGFDTAVSIATEAIDRLHTTAESHERIMVVEVMGRYAGWIAMHAGVAGNAHVILLPEIPYDIDQVCKWVENRFRLDYAPIIVVAEGAKPRRATRSCSAARRTRSATCGSAGSATTSPARSSRARGRRRAPRSSGTCSAAAPRPPATAGWPPASGCTRSTRWPPASGGR